jgi:periplasmic protein CpxP/Spy
MSIRNFVKSMLAFSLLVMSVSGFAQQQQQMPRTPEERAQRQMVWMQQNLSLNDDQNKKVNDILLRYAKQADQTMNAPAGPEKRSARMEMQKNKDAELKGVLTGDQFQKYQAREQEMKDKMQQRNMQNGGN